MMATEGETKRVGEIAADYDETQGTRVNDPSRETIRVDTHRTTEASDASFRMNMQDIMAAAMQVAVDIVEREILDVDTDLRPRALTMTANVCQRSVSRKSVPLFRNSVWKTVMISKGGFSGLRKLDQSIKFPRIY